MQAFLWWRPEVAQRDMELIRDAGFRWVKQAFAWREIEGSGKGQYDWSVSDRIVDQAESIGLHVIARLDSDPSWASGQVYPNANNIIMTPPNDLQDFADFCYNLASRYKGRIAAYQLWNEPNLSREWGGMAPDPEGYVRFLKAGYEAIKRGDPNAIVISAGLAPTTRRDQVAMPDTEYLKRMYAAGAGPYFDALGAHGAGYRSPPEMDPGEVANDPNYYNNGDPNCPGPLCRIYCFRHVEDLRQIMVDNGDTDKQVVVLEFGWTIDERPDSPYAWHAVSEEQQADYFIRAYQYAKQHWQPWAGVLSLIYMPDVDWTEADEQYWWSIAVPNYPQFLPRKAYRDLAPMEK
jgi:polysaccharide biosynthesis protein PslG